MRDLAYGGAAAPLSNIFFAILPDPDTAERMAHLAGRLRSDHGLKGLPTSPERLHVSIYSLGAGQGTPPPELLSVADRIVSYVKTTRFELRFDRVSSFKNSGRRPLVLTGGRYGVAGFVTLYGSFCTALKRVVPRYRVKRAITPHLTLLYDDVALPETAIPPMRIAVREVVLVQSLKGQSRHVHLARWPLAA